MCTYVPHLYICTKVLVVENGRKIEVNYIHKKHFYSHVYKTLLYDIYDIVEENFMTEFAEDDFS